MINPNSINNETQTKNPQQEQKQQADNRKKTHYKKMQETPQHKEAEE